LIRYHVWWPDPGNDPYYLYNQSDNRTRANYYVVDYTPHFWIDGNVNGGYNSGGWSNQLRTESNVAAPIAMTLSGNFDRDSLNGNLNVNVIVESDPALNNLKLRVALIESGLYYAAPNGSRYHHQVFRDMFPTTAGLGVTLPVGDTLDYSVRFTCPSPIRPDSCFLVAFIQSDQNKRIIQAARIPLRFMTVGIDDNTPTPKLFSLSQNYPNPFNAQTTISFSTEGGATSLEVFDLSGARVATLLDKNLGAGSYSVVWNGQDKDGKTVSSGTYFYRLKDETGASIKKMTLLK
jgi:hypothetical protein